MFEFNDVINWVQDFGVEVCVYLWWTVLFGVKLISPFLVLFGIVFLNEFDIPIWVHSIWFAISFAGALGLPIFLCIHHLLIMVSPFYTTGWSNWLCNYVIWLLKWCAGLFLANCLWWLVSCLYVAYVSFTTNKWQQVFITAGIYAVFFWFLIMIHANILEIMLYEYV